MNKKAISLFEDNNIVKFEDIIIAPLYCLNPLINNGLNHDFYEENKYFMNPLVQDSLKSDEEKTQAGIIVNDDPIKLIYKDENNKFPDYYSCDKIMQKLKEINSCFFETFQKNERLKEAELEMQLFRKKKTTIYDTINGGEIKEEVMYEIGRKRKNDETQRNHDKYKSDNIIKKIKSKFFEYLVTFINKILETYNAGRKKKDFIIIKNLYYKKYISDITIKDNLKYLYQTLKDLLSQEISHRFKNDDINFNKKNISKILEEEKNNTDINYIFNLKFKEWIDILTLKKEVENEKIKNNMPKIDDLLTDIFKKNNNDIVYLNYVIFYMFNFENWFIIRAPRKKGLKKELRKNEKK